MAIGSLCILLPHDRSALLRPSLRTVASAGTDPTDDLNPTVVTALAERGISLAGVASKPITNELLANADLAITMSRHAASPTLPPGAARQQHWRLDLPGDDLEAMRSFCDEVDRQVQALLASLQPPTPCYRHEPRRPG